MLYDVGLVYSRQLVRQFFYPSFCSCLPGGGRFLAY